MARHRYPKRRRIYPKLNVATTLSTAQKALQIALQVKKLINVEYNFIDTLQTAVIPITPALQQLTNIVQGDTNITRNGSQIKLVSIMLNYFIAQHASAVTTVVRVMLIHDRQTNEAAFLAADVLQDITAGDAINSPRELDHLRRFSVLYSRVHLLQDSGTKLVKGGFRKKLQLKLRYDANAGTISDLTQSSLALMIMSNEGTNTPTITSFVRILFVDN